MTLPQTLDLRDAARAHAPFLDQVREELRAAAVRTWRARMVNEYASSEVFLALAAQLDEAGFGAAWVEECAAFAEEERRHGVLCGAVVEALGGEARAEIPPRDPFPAHDDTTRRGAVMRNVMSVCCMSETVAVALIGAERLEMPEGALRDLLSSIYADEVGHARFGWRLFEAVARMLTLDERRDVARYFPIALQHLVAHELAHLPDRHAPTYGPTLGLCSGKDARVLLFETIDEVIRPALAAVFPEIGAAS